MRRRRRTSKLPSAVVILVLATLALAGQFLPKKAEPKAVSPPVTAPQKQTADYSGQPYKSQFVRSHGRKDGTVVKSYARRRN